MQTPAGWNTGPQRLPEHLIYFVAEGRCAALLDGKRLWPSTGSLCWVSPGTPFRFFARGGDAPPVIYRFRFTVQQAKRFFRGRWPYRFLPVAWPLLETVKGIILEKERPGKFAAWRMRHLLSLFSIEVFESRPVRQRRGAVLDDGQRARLAALLTETPQLHRRPSELARHLGFSADYFTRLFRRSYGMAPRKWLLEQRLRHAAALLRESRERISEVAARLGYPEVYLFSRQFHRMFGVSPSQWRRRGE